MKKATLFILSTIIIVSGFAQNRVSVPQEVINRSAPQFEYAANMNPG